MKRIRAVKTALVLLLALGAALAACGCSCTVEGGVHTCRTYTFSVETGDRVRLALDTADGYDLSAELPFEISQDGTVLTQGVFIEAAQYESYAAAVAADPDAALIESGERDGNPYLFWRYGMSEYNIALLLDGSRTGVLLGNAVSEASARACFDRLTVALAQD